MDLKDSSVTGKVIQFVVEVLEHLKFNNVHFVSLDVVAIQNLNGIEGWLTEKKEVVS